MGLSFKAEKGVRGGRWAEAKDARVSLCSCGWSSWCRADGGNVKECTREEKEGKQREESRQETHWALPLYCKKKKIQISVCALIDTKRTHLFIFTKRPSAGEMGQSAAILQPFGNIREALEVGLVVDREMAVHWRQHRNLARELYIKVRCVCRSPDLGEERRRDLLV